MISSEIETQAHGRDLEQQDRRTLNRVRYSAPKKVRER